MGAPSSSCKVMASTACPCYEESEFPHREKCAVCSALGGRSRASCPRLFVFQSTTRSGRANPPHCFVVSELRESCRRSAARSGLRLFLSFCRTRPKSGCSSPDVARLGCHYRLLPFSPVSSRNSATSFFRLLRERRIGYLSCSVPQPEVSPGLV